MLGTIMWPVSQSWPCHPREGRKKTVQRTLEAIQSKGPITAAARHLGMCYRRAWLLVQEINGALQQPAITTSVGGRRGSSGAAVTSVGEEVVKLCHSIQGRTHTSAH
jgi:molybdate transport system regulatory protein